MKLKAKLPKGNLDGLSPYELAIDHNPEDRVLAIVSLYPFSRTEQLESGLHEITLEISHVELVPVGSDALLVQDVLARQYKRRTGDDTLPFDFDGQIVDPDSGVVTDEDDDEDDEEGEG